MNTDYELIHRLVLEELAEVISDEDLVYLKATMREDPEAFNIWFETRNILNEPDVKEFLERDRPVEKIFQATLKDKTKRRPGSWPFYLLSIAAVIIAGLCIFHFYYPISPRFPVTPQTAVSKGILLELPSSGAIDLSQQKGTVLLNHVTINHTGNAMTYTAANKPSGLATLTVPQGKDFKVTLSDGSIIWLNATTRLQFPLSFTGVTREIFINGEAFIEVAKSTKPFYVKLPGTTLQVLGTTFNINSYDSNQVQVSLVTGSLKILDKTHELVLHPGEQAIHSPTGMHVTSFDSTDVLSWRQGSHMFNNSSLTEVAMMIPRYYGKQVIMDNPAKGNARFTGVLDKNQPVEHSLNILKSTSNFDYYIQDNIIHIK
jgi:hypothetical protein